MKFYLQFQQKMLQKYIEIIYIVIIVIEKIFILLIKMNEF